MLVTEMEMPDYTVLDDPSLGPAERLAITQAAADESWIARGMFGHAILHYEDVVAMLRDKRWHSASGRLAEMSGIENPEWLKRRRQSILSRIDFVRSLGHQRRLLSKRPVVFFLFPKFPEQFGSRLFDECDRIVTHVAIGLV